MTRPVLHVEGLTTHFLTDDGVVRAVEDVSFSVAQGETLGIVGESGSGKSVTNLSILGLIPQPPGKIVAGKAFFDGQDLLGLDARALTRIRGRRIAMIFQDPMTSLNPFLTVGEQLTEVTRIHLRHTARQALEHAIGLLDRVGIPSPDRRIFDYPHQFSGGMRQRVMIAMALSCEPELLIADEPTTALDVTIQAQILDLMKDLQREKGTAIILITHDLGVVANMSHRVCVMYAGRIVEEAPVEALFERPMHPYTIGLLESMPRLDAPLDTPLMPIEGQPPDMSVPIPGCAFEPRCRWAAESCRSSLPPSYESAPDHRHACRVQAEQGLTASVPASGTAAKGDVDG